MSRRKSVRGSIKAYRAAGRMFGQTFHSGTFPPADVPGTCPECGEHAYWKRAESVGGDGVALVPCYGCIKARAERTGGAV